MARFIVSQEKAIAQYNKVAALGDFVSYSSKTNPLITPVLEAETDSLFSIHMHNELQHVADKQRVIFLAQGWTATEIGALVAQGVRWFVVDNVVDLQILEDFLTGFDGKINLLLRIKLKENTLRTEKYFVFGMRAAVVSTQLQRLRGNSKIDLLGVHFHRKTQNMAEWHLENDFIGMVSEVDLQSIDIVCIGGGLPSEYANTNVAVIDGIMNRITGFRDFLHEKGIKLLIEPGRFIAAPAGRLVTRIKRVHGETIVVNASVYNSDMDALVVPVKLLVDGELSKDALEQLPPEKKDSVGRFVVKGITPCSLDLFRYRVYLPKDVVVEGNELVFLNAGAYNFSTDFCNLETLETEVV